MESKIYLIGGGEMNLGETKLIDKNFVSFFKENKYLLFFPAASYDNDMYISSISKEFKNIGGIDTKVVYTQDDKTEIEKLLENTGGIYIGGGQTKNLIDFSKDKNLASIIRKAIKKGIHIAGMSAGALIMGDWYIHEDGGNLEIRKGLGIVPNSCIYVHANRFDFNKIVSLWEKHTESKKTRLLAIEEGAALISEKNELHHIGDSRTWIVNK